MTSRAFSCAEFSCSSGIRRWALLGSTSMALATACSSQPGSELTESVEQALEAGQFVLLNEIKINPPSGTDAATITTFLLWPRARAGSAAVHAAPLVTGNVTGLVASGIF